MQDHVISCIQSARPMPLDDFAMRCVGTLVSDAMKRLIVIQVLPRFRSWYLALLRILSPPSPPEKDHDMALVICEGFGDGFWPERWIEEQGKGKSRRREGVASPDDIGMRDVLEVIDRLRKELGAVVVNTVQGLWSTGSSPFFASHLPPPYPAPFASAGWQPSAEGPNDLAPWAINIHITLTRRLAPYQYPQETVLAKALGDLDVIARETPPIQEFKGMIRMPGGDGLLGTAGGDEFTDTRSPRLSNPNPASLSSPRQSLVSSRHPQQVYSEYSMSKVSTAPTPQQKAPTTVPTTSSAWSRGPPPAATQSASPTKPTISSSQQPPAGKSQPNGVINGQAPNGVAPIPIGGHSRKASIMAIGGDGMDIKPRGNLAFGTVDSENSMLSSSPAAPHITGTHLDDNVKSFGSVEAEADANAANLVKARRTSTLNVSSPAAGPAKKLDVHALFGAKPQAQAVPPTDRRQSVGQSFQPSGLPNSSSHPFQPLNGNLRPPPTGMSQPRSPVMGQPQYSGQPQPQPGFRPQMAQPQRSNAQMPPMQQRMGQGMGQYGMHPGQQGPGYPMMGYQPQPGYYGGYNMYDQQQQYGIQPQWAPQHHPQHQAQQTPTFNSNLSPRAGQAQLHGAQPSPSPIPTNLPGSNGSTPMPTPPSRPQTLNHQPSSSTASIPSIPSTPSRPLQPTQSFTPQMLQQVPNLSAGAIAFTPRKATSAIKISRPDGTALNLKEAAAAAGTKGSPLPARVNTPEAAPIEVEAPKKKMPTLPVVVRIESEDQKKIREEEERRKERIRKEEEMEEKERKERKERVAKEEEEKKVKAAKEAKEAEAKQLADALAAEEAATKKAAEEREAIAKAQKEKEDREAAEEAAAAQAAAKEAREKADEQRLALLTPTTQSAATSPLASPNLAGAGLPPKPVAAAAALNGAVNGVRRPVPSALELSASPALSEDASSASPSALGSARPIEDISSIVYPGQFKSPSLKLNVDAAPGKFRYDREFLLQFMDVCRDKPDTLPNLEAIGLEADANSGFARGPRPSRNSMGVPGRGAPSGLNINMGRFGASAGFNMGTFATSRPTTSEDRYQQSLAGGSRISGGRTPSQGGGTRLPSMHGLPGMAPSASRSGTGRGSGRGGKRPVQQSFQAEPDVAPLVSTGNAWSTAKTAQIDEKSPAFIERKVKSLLNKLTAEKFDSISTQILDWANKSQFEADGMTLKLVIKLVFEKATDEAHWSNMYARLCRMLLDRLDPNVTEVIDGKPVSGGSLFRKYLLGRCQLDFESGWKAREDAATAAAAKSEEDKERLAKHEAEKTEENAEAAMLSDEYYAAQKAKRRGLGLVQLIGELFKLDMLSKSVIRGCLIKLLSNMNDPDEEDLESTCKLLTTIGASFEATSSDSMNIIFERLETIVKSDAIISRMKFMILDVIDLRKNKWQARNKQAGVMTIAEIHEQAAKEQAQKSAHAAQSARENRESISRGGSRSGQTRGGQPGEWQNVAQGARPTQRPSDYSAFGRNIPSAGTASQPNFTPSSVFARKAGKNNVSGLATPPISRPTSTTNMFGVLSGEAEPAATAAPAADAPQRKKLNLKPRTKPLPGDGEEGAEEAGDDAEGEEEASSEDEAVETPAENTGEMSTVAAKAKIATDVKELWGEKDAGGSRNPSDIVEYFEALPAQCRHLLAEQLMEDVFRISKVKDAEVVSKGWAAALEKEVVTPDDLKKGLESRMPGLDDDSIDFPQAYKAIAVLMRGISLSQEEIDTLCGKVDVYGEPKITPQMKLERALTQVDEDAAKAATTNLHLREYYHVHHSVASLNIFIISSMAGQAASRQTYLLVLAAGLVLRIAVFSTRLPSVLEGRPELSTPLTSFRSLREGVYIYGKGTNPYEGGVFYHSPLYLAFFTYIIPSSSRIQTSSFWSLVDIVSAMALVSIWKTRIRRSGCSSGKEERDALVAALYLFNPYTLMSCFARSTTSLDNSMLLLSVSSACDGASLQSLLRLALAAHASLYPVLLLPPIIMLLNTRTSPLETLTIRPVGQTLLFLTFSLLLAGLNWCLVGWQWLPQTWGTIITVSDLTPNVGMWWYFFTEMFDHFRNFFLGVFQLHTLIYVAPVCMRLRNDPLLAILVLMGVFGTWKSYPTLGDTAVWAGLLGCFPEVVGNLRHPLFSLTCHLYTLILLPLLHSLWLLTGTGNANFFYAATMVYGLNSGLAVADMLGAGIRADIKRKAGRELGVPEPGEGEVWDRGRLDEAWLDRGWEVVQFTGLGD
ncbi:GPI-anchor transamidase subunit U, partial [Tremellales sp. Uapishka_1]